MSLFDRAAYAAPLDAPVVAQSRSTSLISGSDHGREGQVTPPLDTTATAGDVETALEDLTTVDNVTVTGSAGGPWTVTFGGSQAGTNVATLQGDAANLAGGDLVRTIAYEFDDAGQLLSASDPDSEYAYAYDALGRVTQVDNDGTTDAPHVVLDMTYAAASRRKSLAATLVFFLIAISSA